MKTNSKYIKRSNLTHIMEDLSIEEMTTLQGGSIRVTRSFNGILNRSFNTNDDSVGGIAAGGDVAIQVGVLNKA
jgi:hypothetical protein